MRACSTLSRRMPLGYSCYLDQGTEDSSPLFLRRALSSSSPYLPQPPFPPQGLTKQLAHMPDTKQNIALYSTNRETKINLLFRGNTLHCYDKKKTAVSGDLYKTAFVLSLHKRCSLRAVKGY